MTNLLTRLKNLVLGIKNVRINKLEFASLEALSKSKLEATEKFLQWDKHIAKGHEMAGSDGGMEGIANALNIANAMNSGEEKIAKSFDGSATKCKVIPFSDVEPGCYFRFTWNPDVEWKKLDNRTVVRHNPDMTLSYQTTFVDELPVFVEDQDTK